MKKCFLFLGIVGGALFFNVSCGESNDSSNSLRSLIADGAEIKQVATGFKFTEGPVVAADGTLYFSDIPNKRIHRVSPEGRLEVYRENSGGANGLYFDKNGNLIACEGKARRVTRDNLKGEREVLIEAYEGKKLNSPNDLWIDPQGGIYFTDPRYGKQEGMEQNGMHVYYLKPDKTIIRVEENMKRPNGIIGTPDGKILYIADRGDSKIWKYQIGEGGKLRDKTLVIEEKSDGMTLDELGNLYLTHQEVIVVNVSGKKGAKEKRGQIVEKIKFPEIPSNVTFGGKKGKTLYVTARTSVYQLELRVRGAFVD